MVTCFKVSYTLGLGDSAGRGLKLPILTSLGEARLSTEPLASEAGEESSRAGLIECWVNQESRRRAGWMIWLLDSIVQYEFNCSPLMQNGVAGALLPCKEDIWDQPTASLTSSDQLNNSVTLFDALEMLYMEKSLPPNLGDLSTDVLIFAILQRTREAAVQHQTELTFWSPNSKKQPRLQCRTQAETSWPPAIPALSKWRNSACDCFDILHWKANSIAARAGGWEHPTIFHLHTARLALLAPIRHIQQLAAAHAASMSREAESTGSSTARYHVFQWAIRDQYKARLSVIHAGALLWHVRRYSSNSFLEPFAVYTATLVIWAYSTSVQRVSGKPGGDNVALDGLRSENTIMRQGQQRPLDASETLDSDESQGETEPTVIQLDRPCDDEIVQAYVCLGHKMSARMSRVGDILGSSAPSRILKQGIRLMTRTQRQFVGVSSPSRRTPSSTGGDSEAAFPGWGAERSFVNSLRGLASVVAGATPEGNSGNHPE
ncbi:hypothetical protein BJX68DRAFT_267372 [Aspergillus pseudodeflectus]|uniref:Transcription factor domain-containing protein n=1 Tax=Aspergillus pseudodeflectus TaxID=176178 RepID=A0ABR4KCS7_9EURO